MPRVSPQCSHITQKRGIYHYRRRLPGHARGEVLVSLRTRNYREAEHLAALMDWRFAETWRLAVSEADQTSQLRVILRDALRETLDDDVRRRLERPEGHAIYAGWWDPSDDITAAEADLKVIRAAKTDFERSLAENRPNDMIEDDAERLLCQHGLPMSLKQALVYGLMEVAHRRWEVAELRSLGKTPVVIQCDGPETIEPAGAPQPRADRRSVEPTPRSDVPDRPVVTASSLVERFFERRESTDGTTFQVMGQERGTLRRFLEAAGDRPVETYTRADITGFLATLRRLPQTYGKSPSDKDRSLADLIAAADAKQALRLTDKTVDFH